MKEGKGLPLAELDTRNSSFELLKFLLSHSIPSLAYDCKFSFSCATLRAFLQFIPLLQEKTSLSSC